MLEDKDKIQDDLKNQRYGQKTLQGLIVVKARSHTLSWLINYINTGWGKCSIDSLWKNKWRIERGHKVNMSQQCHAVVKKANASESVQQDV